MNARVLWKRYKSCLCDLPKLGFSLDYSRMNFKDNFFKKMDAPIKKAFQEMDALEKGAIANPDEKRMVGHYWLRQASLAPSRSLTRSINQALKDIHTFVGAVHRGTIKPPRAKKFTNVLVIGIGGSALGPQFVAQALGTSKDKMKPYFFDNTDPDGIDKTLAEIGKGLKETLCVVISKSGGTPETRNGMLEAEAAFKKAKLTFAKQAVAVTGEGSKLDKYAVENGFLARFPMWDWVGGRTSELAAVGLLPAALQGLDIDGMLKGAAEMDAATRVKKVKDNPAAILALMWHHATGGKGAKDMVILPYKDRLMLFSKYLQQLVMESLGKEKNLRGKTVYQGIAVYGNKGSTDQHAYVQQLREGVNNFFATFIQVLKDRNGRSPSMEPGVTAGDYLTGFFLGTRTALYDNDRESLTITVEQVDALTVGRLIALYERAVGFYATLVNINAYHQPGVEAGKKAAADVLALQDKVVAGLKAQKGRGLTSEQLAKAIGERNQAETVHKLLEHMAANTDKRLKVRRGKTPFLHRYAM